MADAKDASPESDSEDDPGEPMWRMFESPHRMETAAEEEADATAQTTAEPRDYSEVIGRCGDASQQEREAADLNRPESVSHDYARSIGVLICAQCKGKWRYGKLRSVDPNDTVSVMWEDGCLQSGTNVDDVRRVDEMESRGVVAAALDEESQPEELADCTPTVWDLAKKGDRDGVLEIIDKGHASPNTVEPMSRDGSTPGGRSVFYWACHCRHEELVRALLARGGTDGDGNCSLATTQKIKDILAAAKKHTGPRSNQGEKEEVQLDQVASGQVGPGDTTTAAITYPSDSRSSAPTSSGMNLRVAPAPTDRIHELCSEDPRKRKSQREGEHCRKRRRLNKPEKEVQRD